MISDWEVKVLAAVVIDVQSMESKELSEIKISKVNIRGVQLATLFTRSITHIGLANSICGNPIEIHWVSANRPYRALLFLKLTVLMKQNVRNPTEPPAPFPLFYQVFTPLSYH